MAVEGKVLFGYAVIGSNQNGRETAWYIHICVHNRRFFYILILEKREEGQ